MLFWSEIKYLYYSFDCEFQMILKTATIQVKPTITNRGKIAEIKSLIDQMHWQLVPIWNNRYNIQYQKINVNFYYNEKKYLSIGSKYSDPTPEKNTLFFIEDFIQNGNRQAFSKKGFSEIFNKTSKLLHHYFAVEFPIEAGENLQDEKDKLKNKADLCDRRTVLHTNSYPLIKEPRNPTIIPALIVYHRNGKKYS